MPITDTIITLSRLQFAFTAMFHFLFVPLTLGLTWLLVVLETAYVITNKAVYRDMTKFWGKLLAINFAIGVLTGLTMEFEFGLNWAYFSRLIGGSFGPILAIEGITAFMLEATMFGLFFFTWDKVSKSTHYIITILLAFGATMSIINILAANSWMQHPIASEFNYVDMSVDLKSILMLYVNALAQVRIGHVAFAGFLTGAVFMMGISAFYLLHNRDVGFAKRSFAAGAGFGIIAVLTIGFFGDQNGLLVAKDEPAQMAAIEAQWETQKAPASWYLIAFPDQKAEKNRFVIKIPYALSLIATHSLTGTVTGAKQLQLDFRKRVRDGIKAYTALIKLRKKTATAADMAIFQKYRDVLGYGLLLKRYRDDIQNATDEQIAQAAKDGIPQVSVGFWTFRVMLGLWFIMLLLIITGFIYAMKGTLMKHRGFLRLMVYAIPLPWLAAESGWVLTETGRQPWVVHGLLPTFLGSSSIQLSSIITSLSLFIIFYATLLILELVLMFKFARLGPSSLHLGKYHFEKQSADRGEVL